MMVNEPDNKGLAMMQKMGFKIGNGLGPDGEGRRNPVQIGEVKEDKKGIGNKTARQEKKINEERIKQINLKRKAEEQNTAKMFKNSTRQKNIGKFNYLPKNINMAIQKIRSSNLSEKLRNLVTIWTRSILFLENPTFFGHQRSFVRSEQRKRGSSIRQMIPFKISLTKTILTSLKLKS